MCASLIISLCHLSESAMTCIKMKGETTQQVLKGSQGLRRDGNRCSDVTNPAFCPLSAVDVFSLVLLLSLKHRK